MPKIPRSLSGRDLCRCLEVLGYSISRQSGSHIRISAVTTCGPHSMTIPDHESIKIGTLNSILAEVASTHRIPKNELIARLFDR